MVKLAVVGKGGSGKSTFSWLLTQYLASQDQPVLGIDADYNMNLLSNLGIEYSSTLPTLHHSHQSFRQVVGLAEKEPWGNLQNKVLPRFSVNPDDDYTAALVLPVTELIKLIVVGLGDEDVLDSPLCGHGQVAPLKWYLPNLETNGTTVIVDSVAGTDMLNYNLYQGCDALVGIVENHRNSIRVLQQIQQTADRLQMPFYVIFNQAVGETTPTEILQPWNGQLLGSLPRDQAIATYDYTEISDRTKDSVGRIWRSLLCQVQAPEMANPIILAR